MPSAVQPSALPTRKLTMGAAVAPVVALNAEPAVAEIWPQIAPALLSGPSVTTAIAAIAGTLAGVACAYYVKDAPNQPLVLK